MSDLHTDYFDRLIEELPATIGDIARSLSVCLNRNIELTVGENGTWSGELPIAEKSSPGLIVAFRFANQGMLAIIPAALPLPEWYPWPDETESARLQTLAREWSTNLLPGEIEVDARATLSSHDLQESVSTAKPHVAARFVLLNVVAESAEAEDEESSSPDRQVPPRQIVLLGPVAEPPIELPASTTPAAGESADDQAQVDNQHDAPEGNVAEFDKMEDEDNHQETPHAPKKRRVSSPLLKLPVNVVVMLAEKKIELGQLLSLCPGSIVTFDKSCDDMLDLYVNNQRYCRGEAIKIGEHFGLKVNEVRPQPTRVAKIL